MFWKKIKDSPAAVAAPISAPEPEPKNRAIVFVDFEHWVVSMEKLYAKKPNIRLWYKKLQESWSVSELVFFADFTKSGLRSELANIRAVTNLVIDTQPHSSCAEKDFTDFLMLDYIYRKAITEKDVGTFIIFTGDGHFTPVVHFLKNVCGKTVGIYGVEDATNALLKKAASWCLTLPFAEERALENNCAKWLIERFAYISAQPVGKIIPTFTNTVNNIAISHNITEFEVKETLEKMVAAGYFHRKVEYVSLTDQVAVLKIDWDALIRDGLWNPETQAVCR
jgi:hypothetical protein